MIGLIGSSIVETVNVDRQLAAVMFTDIEGFTAMMQDDEDVAFAKRDRYVDVLEEQHRVFDGTLVQFFGDGSLSMFPNSVDAVLCGIAVQQILQTSPEVPVRIGIHVGNVVLEQAGLIGDAVNIASRIESFGLAGAVLVSDSVEDQIRNQPSIDLVDLGRFRLKNVGRPFSIYAVDAPGIQVPAPGYVQGKGEQLANLPANLPERFTPLVGRDGDLAALRDLMGGARLVTITGPAGIGKTSTAIEVARNLMHEFLDGVSFVAMADVTEASRVVPTIAEALDVKEHEGRTLREGLFSLIGHKKALLVLDNLEQVIEAASEVGDLVAHCPELKVLVTSRTPLRIDAEKEYRLKPLTVPPTDGGLGSAELTDYAAVELFQQRARSARSTFQVTDENADAVSSICRRLDGLPLAIELAAARIRILTPEDLLNRLEDVLDVLTVAGRDKPERQQTLRAAIDWSHSLLDDSEKQLFRRMAVFIGGVRIDDIASTCGEADAEVLDPLDSLVDKALVAVEGDRFAMLQTVRDFAEERLHESGELEAIRTRHARHYAGVTRDIRDGLEGAEQPLWMERGIMEEPNIQVAIDYLRDLAQSGDTRAAETGMSAVGDLWLYWHIRGKHLTARNNSRSFLQLSPQSSPGMASVLVMAGIASWALGDTTRAIVELSEAYAIAERLDDAYLVSTALLGLVVANLNVDLDEVLSLCSKGIGLLKQLDYPQHLGFMLAFDGIARFMTGDIEGAKNRLEQALDIQEPRGDFEGAGVSLAGLAALTQNDGDTERAIDLFERALAAFETVGDRAEEARVLSEMAWAYLASGQLASAHRAFVDSARAYEDLGSPPGIGTCLIGLAAVAAEQGHPKEALVIASTAERLSEQEGVVVTYAEDNPGRQYLDAAAASLTPDDIEQATNQGIGLSTREAIEMAIREASTVPTR